MNATAAKRYKTADSSLNAVYKKVKREYQSDTNFIESLKTAQLAWIKLRDAEVQMRYPEKDKRTQYGSVYPVCYYTLMQELTEARTKNLMLLYGHAVIFGMLF